MRVAVGPRLRALGSYECLEKLTANHLGRVAVVIDGQPLIFPVNYAMWDRQIVFRTGSDTKLHAAIGRRVAFEIDGVDSVYHEGWSVLVVGTAREERDPERLRELEELPLVPWAGPAARWISISGGEITGRGITHAVADG